MNSTRRHRVRLGISTLAVFGATLAASSARADATSKCATTLDCSSGQASLATSGRTDLSTTIDSGWLPSCGGGQDHCSDNPIQVRANLRLAPVSDDGKPLYEIAMPKGAIVDVTWPDKDQLTLKLSNGATTDGSFKITHTIVPSVSLYVGLILNQSFDFDAASLLAYAPGSDFNYVASATGAFAPWALDGAQVTVPGPDLSQSQLVSMPLANVPAIGDLVDGTLALSATTSPTFSFKTTSVKLAGSNDALGSALTTTKVKTPNADALDLVADVTGVLSFKGTMKILPNVTVTRVSSLDGLNLTIPIDVGADVDYSNEQNPVNVVFPRTTIHVPLPNVAVPKDLVDFGTIQTGSQAQKSIVVDNTGELGAALAIESSDPSFSVEKTTAQMGSKSQLELVVRYAPTAAGDAKGTITVKSNDPDSPVQTFDVKGTAAADAPPGSSSNAPTSPQPGANSGCGCRAAPSSSSTAGGALLALAVLGFVRRRRTAPR